MAINDNTSYELFGYQVKDLATKIKSKAEAASLASVATSGLYSDLTGKPTIPTVYNGTLTIQQNGTTVDTFTANSSADKTVNIETITAETVAPAEEVGSITANMIDWSTMPGSYSTTEQKTPFTWIDGKPIYKKTFVVSIPSSGNVVSFQHGINNLGFYVKAEGVAVTSSRVTMRFLPDLYIENDSVNGMFGCAIYGGSVASSGIDITYGSFYRGGTVYATIWYTKTTD